MLCIVAVFDLKGETNTDICYGIGVRSFSGEAAKQADGPTEYVRRWLDEGKSRRGGEANWYTAGSTLSADGWASRQRRSTSYSVWTLGPSSERRALTAPDRNDQR